MRFDDLFGNLRPILGAVALPPLPGSAGFRKDFDAVLRRAMADAQALADAGCDGLLIENRGDGPFSDDFARPETIAAMTVVVKALADTFRCPLGLTLLRNDAPGAVAIAAVTEALFVRVPLHVGKRMTPEGVMEGRHSETMRLRRTLDADLVILADLDIRPNVSPDDLRRDTEAIYFRGLADALIVPDAEAIEQARNAVPDAVILAAGVRPGQAKELFDQARGVILDVAVRADDDAAGPIDPARAKALVRRLRAD